MGWACVPSPLTSTLGLLIQDCDHHFCPALNRLWCGHPLVSHQTNKVLGRSKESWPRMTNTRLPPTQDSYQRGSAENVRTTRVICSRMIRLSLSGRRRMAAAFELKAGDKKEILTENQDTNTDPEDLQVLWEEVERATRSLREESPRVWTMFQRSWSKVAAKRKICTEWRMERRIEAF